MLISDSWNNLAFSLSKLTDNECVHIILFRFIQCKVDSPNERAALWKLAVKENSCNNRTHSISFILAPDPRFSESA